MTFSKVMGTFGGPNVLGVPVRYYTLSTMIRTNITVNAYGDAFVLAIILNPFFHEPTIGFNQRIVGTRKSYETIGGRGFMSQKTKLREWRGVIAGIIIAFQIVVAVGPLILLLWSTFMFRTGDYSLSNFTTAHWIGKGDSKINSGEPGILLNPAIYRGAWNSIRLAVSTAFFTAFLGIILGYAIVKGRGTRLAKITEQLAFIPYVIPGIAFGAVLYHHVHQTGWTHTTALRNFCPPRCGLGGKAYPLFLPQRGFGHAAGGTPAGGSRGSGRCELPEMFYPHYLSPHEYRVCSGFTLTFITTMRELSLIILLVTPATQVLSSMTMRYSENGSEQQAKTQSSWSWLASF